MKTFERVLDSRYCRPVDNADEVTESIDDATLGLYYDCLGTTKVLSLREALYKASYACADAIFSIEPVSAGGLHFS